MLKGAARIIRNPLLRAGDKTPHGSQESITVFPTRQYCQVRGGQFPPHCRLRQRVASNQHGPAALSHRQHPSLPPPPGSGSWGHKGLWITATPKMKGGESYHIINSFCKLIQSLKEVMNNIPSHSQGKWGCLIPKHWRACGLRLSAACCFLM